MEKIWLKSYPQEVPAEINIDRVPTLVDLFEQLAAAWTPGS